MQNTSKGALLLAPLLGFAVTALADTYDGFNRSRWQVVVYGSNPVIREANNRLEVLFPADSEESPVTGGFNGGVTSTCMLQGDFDIRVNYVLVDFPQLNGVRIGLSVSESPVDQVSPAAIERTSFSRHDILAAGEVYLTDFVGAINRVSTSDTQGRLRLTRVESILSGYYFDSNLGDWQLVSSAPYTRNDVAFSVGAWSHDYAFDDKDVRVAFDKVIVDQGILRGHCRD